MSDEPPRAVTVVAAMTRGRRAQIASTIGKAAVVFVLASNAFRFLGPDDMALVMLMSGLTFVGWAVFLAAMIASFVMTQAPTFHAAELTETGDAWLLSGRAALALDKADVASAIVVPRTVEGRETAVVELTMRSGDFVELRAPSFEVAERLVASLGFGAEGTKAIAVDLASRSRRYLHVLVGFALYQLSSMVSGLTVALGLGSSEGPSPLFAIPIFMQTAFIFLAYRWLKRRVRAPVVRLGADGAEIRKGGRRRFIPRSAIARVEQAGRTAPLNIVPHEGEQASLAGVGVDEARREALGRLMVARLARRGAAPVDHAGAYARPGASVGEWRESLRAALEHGSYREAGITVDGAARALSSADVTPEQRIGAALALRVAGAPAEQIRVAASATAEEETRAALEALADEAPDVEAKIRRALDR